jgi:hypothetical protein
MYVMRDCEFPIGTVERTSSAMSGAGQTQTARRIAICLLGGGLLWGIAGCSDKLETGYEPRALKATAAERRGYYAPAFTPEAAAAAQDHSADDVRPVTGHPGGSYR